MRKCKSCDSDTFYRSAKVLSTIQYTVSVEDDGTCNAELECDESQDEHEWIGDTVCIKCGAVLDIHKGRRPYLSKTSKNGVPLVTVLATDLEDADKLVEAELKKPGRELSYKLWNDRGRYIEIRKFMP